MTDASKDPLKLSEGYRGARKTTSLLCAIGLGWSTAQLELKSLSLGPAGVVDLSGASIALFLACGIAYMVTRTALEYAMQPEEVRQWRLAQTDFKLSLLLMRTAFLMLAASGLNRSLDTVMYVAIGTVIVIGGSYLLLYPGTMALMPLMMAIRARQGRFSVASRAFEAYAWSKVIILGVVIALLIGLGFASLYYQPILSLWAAPPSPIAVGIFVLAAVAVTISWNVQPALERKLFTPSARYTQTALPDGSTLMTFEKPKQT